VADAANTCMRAKRELSRPGPFGSYRWFWRGTEWERFLLPNRAGFALSRIRLETHADIGDLAPGPGVYEFAISKGGGRRYKVYIGESGSLRKRHQAYARTGDHLVRLFDIAVKDGCTIWRRCKSVKTKEKAVSWEAWFLARYDYPWNAQQNGRKRAVAIVSRRFCLCMSSLHIVEEVPPPRRTSAVTVVASWHGTTLRR
jgi:GIY-YIG domain-containing protein